MTGGPTGPAPANRLPWLLLGVIERAAEEDMPIGVGNIHLNACTTPGIGLLGVNHVAIVDAAGNHRA